MSLTTGATVAARAQTPPQPPTTQGLLEQVLAGLLTPPTTPPAQTAVAAPVPPTAPAPAAPAPAAPAPPAAEPDTSSQVIPSEYQGTIDWSRARNPRSTAALLDALRRLEDLGFTAEEAAVMGIGQFPVAGPADWEDDWHDPRFGPPFHLHQGTDIFADRGTPVIAPEGGTVRFEDGGLGGRAAYVTTGDGTYYYLAHLNAYADEVYSGATVKQGQVVAYVGNTGNAENGSPHLHFEIHPYGGGATNPKPILDDWLAAAVDNVPTVLAAYGVNVPRAITSAGMLRRFDEGRLAGSGRSPETSLLWASSVTAGGSTLRMAAVEAVRVAGTIDWDRRATTAQLQSDIRREARSVASSVLVPLTPRLVVVLLGPAVSHGNS